MHDSPVPFHGSRYVFDPSRATAQLDEPVLNHLVLRSNHQFATLSEYAHESGCDVARVAESFGPLVDSGVVTFEYVEGEVFVLTAPHGRPGPLHLPEIAPNLWERLRRHALPEQALVLWQAVRDLELGGWEVETDQGRVLAGLGPLEVPGPLLGVYVAARAVPVLTFPDLVDLPGAAGLLERFERASAGLVAVMVEPGALDEAVTVFRKWALQRPGVTGLAVIVLEAPRFDPVLVSAQDSAVRPVAVDRSSLDSMLGD